MRVHTTKKTLTQALSALARVIPARSSNPMLTALHVDPSDAGLTLTGTNLEIDLRVFLPCEVMEAAGPFVVPAHLFTEIVRNMGGELIELELWGSELAIRSGGSDFKIQCGAVDEYPPVTFARRTSLTVDGPALFTALGGVMYAASTEAFQAVLRGVLWRFAGGTLTVVGSDGYRIAVQHLAAPDAPDAALIVPVRSLAEVGRILGDVQGALSLALPTEDAATHGVLELYGERVSVRVRLLDGDFPDWQRVTPQEFSHTVTVSAGALQTAVQRVSVLADKNANNRVELRLDGGLMPSLRLLAEGDYGRAQDTVAVTGTLDEGLDVAYNARFLLDALNVMDGDVTLRVGKGSRVLIIDAPGESGPRAVTVALR